MQGMISSPQTVVQDYYVNGNNIGFYQSGAVAAIIENITDLVEEGVISVE